MPETENQDESNLKTPSQYVYLDFDGERTTYTNTDLNLSFSVRVSNSGYSEEQKQAILAALTEKYAADDVEFVLSRPGGTDYSTLYFGKSDDFSKKGDFWGVSETIDSCNRNGKDNAFILLDSSFSTDQIIAVAENGLDRLLGYEICIKSEKELKDYADNSYLLSTEWSQNSPYNKYCPVDPYTNKRCVTGCSNTASSQIIYYWMESGQLEFTFKLESTDSFSENGVTVNEKAGNASKYKYLSFSETNSLLSDFVLGDEDCIAALNFAVGVVQGAGFSSSSTPAGFSYDLYKRAGFRRSSIRYLWGSSYFLDNYFGMKDEGYEILIDELLHGRPVYAIIEFGYGKKAGHAAHAIVIDGYNSSTDEFHLNFGWGGINNMWCSKKDLNYNYGLCGLLIGIEPLMDPNLSIAGLSVESDALNRGEEIVLSVDVSNSGMNSSVSTTADVYCGDLLLASVTVDPLRREESASYTVTVDTADLTPGTNTLRVEIGSQNAAGDVSSASRTVRLYDGGVNSGDDSWKDAASAEGWTRTMLEYDSDGIVEETVLAGTEYVGFYDRTDFREITLEHAGLYTFTLSGVENDLEFKLYSLTAKGTLSELKTRVVSGSDVGVLPDVSLVRGTYYVSVSAVNWETKGDSTYTLSVEGKGYIKAGNLDDWTDMKTKGIEGGLESVGTITAETTSVVTDEWVGLGDEIDYRMFRITDPAKLSFTVTATDAVKFTVYALQEKTKKGDTTYSLKSLQSTSIKAGKTVRTEGVLLPAGEETNRYFFSVQSSNAAKGGSADYSVSLDPAGSVFFTEGDNSDDWSDLKTNGTGGAVGDAGTLDKDSGTVLSGWVGFGDEIDYAKIRIEHAAKLVFSLGFTDAAEFMISGLTWKTDKNGARVYSLKKIQKTKLKLPKNAVSADSDTKALLLEAGEYYISMRSSNAAKGGSASYTVELTDDCGFYVDADEGGNNWLYDKKNNIVNEFAGVYADADTETRIDLDRDVSHGDYRNFVGFGDVYDYSEIFVNEDGLYNFRIDTTGKAKFSVYSLTRNGKGKWTQKVLGSQTIKDAAGATGVTLKKDVQLAVATDDVRYFISMQALDTKKSPEVYYNVSSFPTVVSEAASLGMPETDTSDVADAPEFAGFDTNALADASAASFAELDGKAGWQNIAVLA